LARLIKKRDDLIAHEKKRIAIKKSKDAQMARAVVLRKALESVARRQKASKGEEKVASK